LFGLSTKGRDCYNLSSEFGTTDSNPNVFEVMINFIIEKSFSCCSSEVIKCNCVRFHLDCLSPPLAEVPEGDWYCESCHAIVQSQYEISMSSPDEESTYVPPYYVVLDSSDDSAASSDSGTTDRSSTIDVTGSGLELDLDSICSDHYADSDYVDVEADTVIPSLISSKGPSQSLYSSRYLDERDFKSYGLSSATDSEHILSDKGDRQDRCNSEDVEISHKSKLKNNDIIVISSSEDDSSISLHRRVPSKKKRNTVSSESDGSRIESVIDVMECTPSSRNEAERHDSNDSDTADLNVDQTPSPSKLSSEGISNLEAGPSCSTPTTSQLGSNCQLTATASTSQTKNTSRGKRKRRQRKRRKPRTFRKSKGRKTKRKVSSSPNINLDRSNSVLRRGRARTAATHTPRVNAMRQAVKESYRHQDKTEGLEWARAVLVNARHSPLRKSGLLGSIPSMSSSVMCDWQKLKGNEKSTSGSDSPNRQDKSTPAYRTYGFESNCVEPFRKSQIRAAKPVVIFPKKRQSLLDNSRNFSSSFSAQDRRKKEIQRRMVSNNKLAAKEASSPWKDQPQRKIFPSSRRKASSDLVDIICKNLDDMENKCEVKKDGTVVPMSK